MLSLLLGMVAITAVAVEEGVCAETATSVKVNVPDGETYVLQKVTVPYELGGTIDLWIEIDGASVSFFFDDGGAPGEPAVVDFCVKAANYNSGPLTGSTFPVDWDKDGTQPPVSPIPDISHVVVYLVHAPTGAIKIAKTGVGGEALTADDGVVFSAQRVDEGGEPIGSPYAMPELDEDGYFCAEGLPFGDYVVSETGVPAGYLPPDDEPVTVDALGTCESVTAIPIENLAAPADIYIEKEDDEGNPVDGVVFTLTGPEGYDESCTTGTILDEFDDPIPGYCEFLNVPLGEDYVLDEELEPGWLFDSATVNSVPISLPYTFDIGLGSDEFGQQFTFVISNLPTGAILIAKTGVGGAVLTAADGVVFEAQLLDELGEPVGDPIAMPELVQTAGYFCAEGLPFGDYLVSETGVPAGYLPMTAFDETVDAVGTCETVTAIDVANSAAPADIYIEKLDPAGAPLDGIVFRLTGPEGYDETCTTVAGACEFLDVPLGTGYVLSETLPAGWAFVSAKLGLVSITLPYTFDIGLGTNGGQQFYFEVVNEWQGEWCSPGFWRNNPLAFQEAIEMAESEGFYEGPFYSTYFDPVVPSKKALREGATTNPTLWQVLQSPEWYGGDAFNNVGDLLSSWHAGVDFDGIRTEDSCPLAADASGIRG
jgi:hypothetical protein